MASDDVNTRKQKLNNIIKKITDSQLLKKREADNKACSRQESKFMHPQERVKEMNKAMSNKLVKEKELAPLVAPGIPKPKTPVPSSEIPEKLPAPVGPGVNL